MEPVEYQKALANGYLETHRFLPYEAETVRGSLQKNCLCEIYQFH